MFKIVKVIFFLMLILIWSCSNDNIKNKKIEKSKKTEQLNISLLNETEHSLKIAFDWLLANQLENGSWKNHPAITALVLTSFKIKPEYNPNEKVKDSIKKGYKYLETFIKPDGGIYENAYANYTTSVSLMAFCAADKKEYKDIIKNAKKFLIKYQCDESENIDSDSAFYGGIGYGGDERPDLSNTQLALDAIKQAELYEEKYKEKVPDSIDKIEGEEKELGVHWKKALVFLARCQNLKKVNDKTYADNDGGFLYETGKYKKDRSHSYGSMTYAGVKSLLYANVSREDIRVKRAVDWIRKHYTLEENPGFGKVSLYYYYLTMSKCLNVLGKEIIVDDKNNKHYWREDMLKKLISIQKGDGYWVNETGRYWENIKELTTAYSIIAMKYALKNIKY